MQLLSRVTQTIPAWLLQLFVIFVGLSVLFGGTWVIGSTEHGIVLVLGVIAAAIGLIVVSDPPLGVYILVFSVYVNLSDVLEVTFGIPSTNKLLIGLIFVSVIGTRAVIQNKTIRLGWVELVILIFVGVALLSLFANGNTSAAFSQMVDYLKDIAIIVVIIQVCDREDVWKRVQWVVLIGAAFLSFLTVFQFVTGSYENEFFGFAKAPVHQIVGELDSVRPTGPIADPNYYAQILLMIFPIAVYRAFDEARGPIKNTAILCSLFIATAVFLTYSRASLLAMGIVLLLILWERKVNLIMVGLVSLAAFVLVLPILPAGYLDRILTLTDLAGGDGIEADLSFEGRTSEMLSAIQMFNDNPILGLGYTNYESHYLEYSIPLGIDRRSAERSAHSLYLELAAETGIIGIASFILLVLGLILGIQYACTQLRRYGRADLIPWLRGVQFGFISYLTTSIVLHDDYNRYFRLSIALAASAITFSSLLIQQIKAEQAARFQLVKRLES